MRQLIPLVALAFVVAACTPSDTTDSTAANEPAEDGSTTSTTEYTGESFAGTIDAPEFPTGLDWINTAAPVTLDSLKGKIVLLDFWTYGCVNCIHILPDLERLEEEFADELVVIGVHSAKFDNEGETENLRDIVQRYEIAHPVVNDRDFQIWSQWGANAWPTIALIDPASRVVGIRAGEGVYEAVQPVIEGLVAEFGAAQAINTERIEFALEANTAPDRPLLYPGKVLAQDGRLFVSDTGHHRVLEVDPASGEVLAAFGSGTSGWVDGAALEAQFDAPQGLALAGSTLYVADTNNHLIRAVDLDTGEVSTLAGTGEQGWPPSIGTLRGTALATPWAIDERNGLLYIANAGTHQIWVADVAFDSLGPLIGNARESTLNGPFLNAELAQPSSVTVSDDGKLYFADSESSAIRVGDLRTNVTSLVVGSDADLFTFGDVDGVGNEARLQHPLGTEVVGLELFVADTYNSKIKRVDLTTNTVASWLGDESGYADGADPLFNEPGGISADAGVLYVADTNNHAIRAIDLATGVTDTIVLKGVEAFDPPTEFTGDVIQLTPVEAGSGAASLVLDYRLPEGYKVNDEAPSSITITAGSDVATFDGATTIDITGTDLPRDVTLSLEGGDTAVQFDVTLIYCEAVNASLCLIDRTRFEVDVTVVDNGPSGQITLAKTIDSPNG